MSDKVDDTDGNPPLEAPKRTLKLKGPRVERAVPAKALPAKPSFSPMPAPVEERPNFLTRIDQVKRQMQADMDALAQPKPPYRKRP